MNLEFNYKITIAYEGTYYSGWQIQSNGVSIQQKINEALSTILRCNIYCIGSGRTDAGVHAKAQVAHFHSTKINDLKEFLYSLNCLLPKDIRVVNMKEVPFDFHARYSAKQKEYHYYLDVNKVKDPFKRFYALHVYYDIDLDLLQKAAKEFIGTHDFTSFANEADSGSASIDAVRTIYRLDLIEKKEGLCLEFEGDGFLYKMVRNITGTLLEVARGKRSVESIKDIIAAKDRAKAGKAAPAHGLTLYAVTYDEP